ncbi:MAG: RimK/LysX family protein [Bythopirellula sp.]|nr:RimK/LysX family protein [Bythopirellula sp.]
MDDQFTPSTEAVPSKLPRLFLSAVILIILGYFLASLLTPKKTLLGATVDVKETSSGTVLKARVDTGASICSLHCKNIVIADAEEAPEENSGKKVRFLLESPDGDTHWLESTILGYAGVRSASGTTNRYQVRLRLLCQGVAKEAIVSLNDRSAMKYPLLLGREFLQDDFIVDVSRDNPDYP